MSRLSMIPMGKDASKRRRRLVLLRFVAVTVVLLIVGMGAWWVKGKVERLLVKVVVDVQPAKTGQLAETRSLPGWIIRDEIVVTAPIAGHVQRLVKDLERVRIGSPVIKIKGVNPSGEQMGPVQDILAPRAGLIVYRLDGLEGVLTPRVLDQLDPERLRTLVEKPLEIQPEGMVEKGFPVFKVINNLEKAHYLTNYKVKELGGPLVPGRRLTLTASPTGSNFSGKVVNVRGAEEAWAVIQLTNPTADVLKERRLPLLIVDRVHKGIILSKDALIQRNGETGVWLSVKNRAEWRAVKILATVGEQVAVEGIEENQLVIQNPALVKEGQEIK